MRFARLLYVAAYPLVALMLIAWAGVTFFGPGWGAMHLLLTLAVALLVWRIMRSDHPPT